VIEVDPPGIGTTSDRRPLRLSDYARGLAHALRREGEDPVVVVGHSLGGLVALRLATDESSLVAGLLLLDPTPLTPHAQPRFTLAAGEVDLRVRSAMVGSVTLSCLGGS
jgi:pimeloyl-ACP methyl ester carboxylesterase